MASATQVSVEEYLHTVYEPDCDYVDGELQERNVGEKSHSKVQLALILYLVPRQKDLRIFVLQEWRMRLSGKHYRVPDLTIVAGPEPDERVLSHPPLICVEILSPEDRMSRVNQKIQDYLAFGVRYVWVLDPETRSAYAYTSAGMHQVNDILRTENPAIEVPLAGLFD